MKEVDAPLEGPHMRDSNRYRCSDGSSELLWTAARTPHRAFVRVALYVTARKNLKGGQLSDRTVESSHEGLMAS